MVSCSSRDGLVLGALDAQTPDTEKPAAVRVALPSFFAEQEQRFLQAIDDFQDPTQEWRRLFSELYGTFFLVIVAAGGGMMGQAFPGTITRTAAVVAPGLMVMAIIMFMGKVSGAHLNPAVSVAFSLRGDFPWRRVPGYVIVQLIGATLASLVCGGSSTSRQSTAATTRRADTRTGEHLRWRHCSPSAW
jgi:hypothetical protein